MHLPLLFSSKSPYIPSIIGTYIELKVDNLHRALYNCVLYLIFSMTGCLVWFMIYLTISDQQMLLVFLHHTQKVKRLYIMGESTLNAEAGLSVTSFKFHFHCSRKKDAETLTES